MKFSRRPICWLASLAICGAPSLPATEITFDVLHEFERPGGQPLAPLVLHSDGNLYGTTVAGGAFGHGAVFRLTPSGGLSTILSFTGTEGAAPGGAPLGVLAEGPGGDLFGTVSAHGSDGFGLAFKLTTSGAYTPLAHFTGESGAVAGAVPGGLVAHPDGSFYGTTQAGGANGHGTVFRMTVGGALTTLLEFSGTGSARPGSLPVGPLVIDGVNLFGVTRAGGSSGEGTAYELTTSGSYRTLAVFDGANGSSPSALVLHSNGLLYGTTEFGGSFDFGTVHALDADSSPNLTVIHHFDDFAGSQPSGRLTELAGGSLAGVASLGGPGAWGGIFEIATDGTFSLLANFTGERGAMPGAEPLAGLTGDGNGNLIGLTSAGGPANLGTVFRIAAGNAPQTLANFSLPQGWFPSGAPHPDDAGGHYFPVALGGDAGGGAVVHLVPGSAPQPLPLGGMLGDQPRGALVKVGSEFFGVTSLGGNLGRGTAFKFLPPATLSLAGTFDLRSGTRAEGPLMPGADGALYGVAHEGGSTGKGTVYRLTTAGERSRLLSFTGTAGVAPGESPRGPLVLANGDFYGVTEAGGSDNGGVIFKVSPAGNFTSLHEFGADGPRAPRGGLTAGADGFLYGATSAGGAQDGGALLRIDPADDSWLEVAAFSAGTGTAPAGVLARGPEGDLYGMTTAGGPNGHGGVFRFSPPSASLESLVFFTGEGGPAPGRALAVEGPELFLGGLSVDAGGVLSGLAPAGGSLGGGVAFRLTLVAPAPLEDWKLTHLGDAQAEDAADPDADGLATLVEYALLGLPEVPDAVDQPRALLHSYPDGDRLAIVVPRDPERSDITVHVEVSNNLQPPWELLASSVEGQPFAGPGVVGGDSATPGLKTVEIRDLAPRTDNRERFFRIRVTRP